MLDGLNSNINKSNKSQIITRMQVQFNSHKFSSQQELLAGIMQPQQVIVVDGLVHTCLAITNRQRVSRLKATI